MSIVDQRSRSLPMTSTEENKSKVLVIGGTGCLGKLMVEASARSGHRTFALVRDISPSDPSKSQILQKFRDLGVILLQGDLYDHESLLRAIRAVDVVISTVGYLQVADQLNIVAAIKEAGNVKRFFPSEFGNDADKVCAVEPAKSMYAQKARIRHAVMSEGIPYTFVCCNLWMGRFLQVSTTYLLPGKSDNAVIFGDGNTKAVFVREEDVAAYTIKTLDDPRTVNKILHVRPQENILSQNELVSLWEEKVGKTFQRVYAPEEEILRSIQGTPEPLNVPRSIIHLVLIKGAHANFGLNLRVCEEATQLYPDIKYTTVDEYLNGILQNI